MCRAGLGCEPSAQGFWGSSALLGVPVQVDNSFCLLWPRWRSPVLPCLQVSPSQGWAHIPCSTEGLDLLLSGDELPLNFYRKINVSGKKYISPSFHNISFGLSYSVTLVPIIYSSQSKTRYQVLLVFLFLFASSSSHGAENQFLISPVKNRFEFNKQEDEIYIFFFV